MGGGCSRDAGPSGQQPEHRPRKVFLDAGLDTDSSQLKHDKLRAGSKELVAKESHRRSLAKKRSAISMAERLMALHAGQNFYDAYERVSLVSYGASCKVMTAYSKSTKLKVACKTIPKVHSGKACGMATRVPVIGMNTCIHAASSGHAPVCAQSHSHQRHAASKCTPMQVTTPGHRLHLFTKLTTAVPLQPATRRAPASRLSRGPPC